MVQKLKFHLSGLGLELKEEWKETGVKSCYSVLLYSDKVPFQWKGLGVTREEALENAYRKLTAQLQSVSWYTGRQDPQLAGSSGFRISPDEKYRSVQELMGMHPRWYYFFYECMRKRSHRYYGKEQMWEVLNQEAESEGEDSMLTLPFQNVSMGITEEVPYSVLEKHYGRDTVFAGDTMEDACIRGLSCLIMKQHMMQIHEMCVTPPDIPEEFLLSYGKVREIVEDIRKKPGYILKLKDCSLEKNFPVVAAVLINQQYGGYLVTFGANPSMEKALEECLTALFAEHSLSHAPRTEEMIFDERELGKIDRMHNILTNFQGEYHYSFFLPESSYFFSLEDRKEPESSEEAYSRCMEYFSSQGYEVYMRNISGLGCAGVQLFVPSFSENGYAPELKMKETASHFRAAKTLDHFGTATRKEIKSLWIFLQYKENFEMENSLSYLAQLPIKHQDDRKRYYFIVLMVCLLQKMYREAGAILRILISCSDSDSEYQYFCCMRMMLSLMEHDHEEPGNRELLTEFFLPETVKLVEETLTSQSSLADVLGFSCNQFRCGECRHASVCRYPQVREIQVRLKQKLKQQIGFCREKAAEEEAEISRRESEVVSYYLNGLSRKEIAEKMMISENTVKKHMSNVFKKTGVKSRAELYEYMKKRAIVMARNRYGL